MPLTQEECRPGLVVRLTVDGRLGKLTSEVFPRGLCNIPSVRVKWEGLRIPTYERVSSLERA